MTARTANAFALIVVIGMISIFSIVVYKSIDFNELCKDNHTTPITRTTTPQIIIWNDSIHSYFEKMNISNKAYKINITLQGHFRLQSSAGFYATKVNNSIVIVFISYYINSVGYHLEMLNKSGHSLKSISLKPFNIYLPRIALQDQTVILYHRNATVKYAIPSGIEIAKNLKPFKDSLNGKIIDAKEDPVTKKIYVLGDNNNVYLTNYENVTFELIETNSENGMTYSMAVYNGKFYYLKRNNHNYNSYLYIQSNSSNKKSRFKYICQDHHLNRINVYKHGFLIISCYIDNVIKIYTLDGQFVMNFLDDRPNRKENITNFYFDSDFYLMTSSGSIEIYESNRSK